MVDIKEKISFKEAINRIKKLEKEIRGLNQIVKSNFTKLRFLMKSYLKTPGYYRVWKTKELNWKEEKNVPH